MNFLALLLGLAVERMLTHLFHLRAFQWLDPLLDAFLRRLQAAPGASGGSLRKAVAIALTCVLAALLVLPVALLAAALHDEMLQIPYFLFSVVVLLFSLGPRDLDDEVEEYLAALQSDDEAARLQVAAQLLESPSPVPLAKDNEAVERAIYVQANNRIFGVVFWFLVLGPSGAWAFRVLDLLRHRVALKSAALRVQEPEPGEVAVSAMSAVRLVHGLFAWVPSRLLALGYALAGNFEDAIAGWRNRGREATLPLADGSAEIMARVGTAASGRGALDASDREEAMDRVRGARALVMRTLWMIWCPVIAVLTLYDWVA